MNKSDTFRDNTQKYKSLIPASEKGNIGLYKDILYNVDLLQNKLQKNFYRVTHIEKLREAVKKGEIRVGKYSIIEEKGSSFRLVSFSDFFEKEFNEIKKLLEKLESQLDDSDYKNYISSLATAYSNNNFIEPYKRWIQLDNSYPVDFVAFPTEPDLDKEFNTILSFDGSLRVLSPEFMNYKLEEYTSYLYSVLKSLPSFSELHDSANEDRLNFRVDYSLISTGVHHIRKFYGQNLPNERKFALDWGSKIVVYKTVLDESTSDTLTKMGDDLIKDYDLSSDDLTISLSQKFLAHEITESLMKFEGDEDRLKSYYLRTREMNSEVSGIKNYILFLLKHEDGDKQITNLIHSFILSAFSYYKRKHKPENRSPHYYGYVYTINYLFSTGAIEEKDGKINVNVKSAVSGISDLADKIGNLLMSGNEEDAEKFFSENMEEDVFKRLLNIS